MPALRSRKWPGPAKKGGAPRSKTIDAWLDGRVWEFQQGKEFQTSPLVFQGMLRKAAKRRNLRLRYADQGDGKILIQAYDP